MSAQQPPAGATVERVPIDCGAARRFLASASRFILDGGNNGLSSESRFLLLYDGMRNAIAGVLAAEGLRVTDGRGSHALAISEAARILGGPHAATMATANVSRNTRNKVAYQNQAVGASQVTSVTTAASAVVAAATAHVDGKCP